MIEPEVLALTELIDAALAVSELEPTPAAGTSVRFLDGSGNVVAPPNGYEWVHVYIGEQRLCQIPVSTLAARAAEIRAARN